MTTLSCTSDHSGETPSPGGRDAEMEGAEVAIGSLGPQGLPYACAGLEAGGSSHDLPSTSSLGSTKCSDGDDLPSAGNLVQPESKGDAAEIAGNSHQQEEEKDKDDEGKEEEKDEVMKDLKSDKDEQDLKLKLTQEEQKQAEEEQKKKAAEEQKKKAEEEEKANRNALLLLTMMLVVAVPAVAWRPISKPELVLWRQSLLICCCCITWSHLLDAAMSVWTMLLIFSSSFLLALHADSVLDSRMGALIAHLSSCFAAGMVGYTLAERRQRDGIEVSAAAAAARKPSDEKKADELHYFQTLGCLYCTLITLGFAVPVAWIVWHRANYSIEQLMVYVLVPLSGVLMFWIMAVAGMLLQGSLIQEAGICLLFLYFAFSGLLFTMVSVLVGETGAMIFISLSVLGFPGFFGYSLSVYALFKLRLKQLQVNADESKVELPLRSSLDKSDESVKQPPLQSAPMSASVLSD